MKKIFAITFLISAAACSKSGSPGQGHPQKKFPADQPKSVTLNRTGERTDLYDFISGNRGDADDARTYQLNFMFDNSNFRKGAHDRFDAENVSGDKAKIFDVGNLECKDIETTPSDSMSYQLFVVAKDNLKNSATSRADVQEKHCYLVDSTNAEGTHIVALFYVEQYEKLKSVTLSQLKVVEASRK